MIGRMIIVLLVEIWQFALFVESDGATQHRLVIILLVEVVRVKQTSRKRMGVIRAREERVWEIREGVKSGTARGEHREGRSGWWGRREGARGMGVCARDCHWLLILIQCDSGQPPTGPVIPRCSWPLYSCSYLSTHKSSLFLSNIEIDVLDIINLIHKQRYTCDPPQHKACRKTA